MPKTDGTLKIEVRHLLRYGKENVRTGAALAKILGLKDDRPVRLVIRELIADGVPIASSVTPPLGYFIATSVEEAAHYMKVLKSRLVNDAYRRRDFKVAAKEVLEPAQLGLL